MKKIYFKLVLILLLIGIFTTVFPRGQSLKVNIEENNIKSHIDLLTSAEYEGRLIGTKGNEKTLEYIENHFKAIGLHKLNDEGYRKEFDAVSFTWNGAPKFNAMDTNGNLIGSYEEQKDFIFRMDNMSLGGSFKGNIAHITEPKELNESNDKFKDQAVLIDYEDDNIKKLQLSQQEVDDRLYYIGKAKVVIYLESNPIKARYTNLGYKNKLLPTKGIIKIGVNKEIYEELIDYKSKGYALDIDIPIAFHEVTSSNIYGVLPGKSYPNGNYIVIATSIDGLGANWNGQYYPGASDNGASTSLMLELARVLTSKEEKIGSSIIFAGFNGKHTGSVGVEEYLRDPLIPQEKTEIIYLDKLSSEEESPLKVATFLNSRIERKVAKKVLSQLANIANNQKIKYELDDMYPYGEYVLFRNFGIIASTLTYDNNQHIGTAMDTANNINLSKAKEVGVLVDEYLAYYGKVNLLSEIGYVLRSTWWLLAIGIVLIILKHSITDKRGFEKLGNWFNSKPIMSMYLLISSFVTVLIIQTRHNISETEGILLKDIVINGNSIGNMLAANIFTTVPMLGYLSVVIIPIILIITALNYFSKKINKNLYILLISLITYVVFMKFFNQFYDDTYTIIYPNLLSFYGSQHIIILSILLFSLVTTWIFNKETQNANYLKTTVIFLISFIFLTSFTYSPYVFSKEIISIRAIGGRLKL